MPSPPTAAAHGTAHPHDAPAPLRCTARSDHGPTVELRLAGEIDLSSAGLLEGWLAAAQAGGAPVLLDLRDIVFFDSAGVKALLHAAERSPVRVRNVDRAIRRTMAITGLDRVVTVDSDAPAA